MRKLNIGSSSILLDGWINMEQNEPYWRQAAKGAIGWGRRLGPTASRGMPQEFGDALQLKYRSDYFDVVRSCHLLQHVPQTQMHRALEEQFRVLRPGGWCRVIVPGLDKMIDRWNNQSEHVEFWDTMRNDPALWKRSERGVPFRSNSETLSHMIHLNGENHNSFTLLGLFEAMERVGFVNIATCDEVEADLAGPTVMEINLRVHGQRPAND